ncbi:uncharacterized protein DUF4360 [Herbihabitans rhizosphaerae]|uniref:Uncharacterized protein DUF4360 n=1 Tax=Herbihabitans rhizosphaerae TaxID=1872711 RepID=A0A4Q7KGE9_9PSEU|nr:DUF4360 domain-containing protein [Herbihabitans rhizosphaerae]RZS33931.1 uncharacterized protein DUF4360 [Herbihabitans rhizosphaerae]
MLTLLTAAGLALSTILAPMGGDESPASTPTPDKITINVETVNGSGCRPGTAKVTPSPDKTSFAVTYSEYTAEAGGAEPTDMRKNCQLVLRISIPQGFTYAIARADYGGFARLAGGAHALQQANYYFQGSSDNNVSSHPIDGPYSDDWHFTDRASEPVYAPCGAERMLNINTELRVNTGSSGDARSFMTMDSTYAGVRSNYHFQWKEC